METRGLMWGLTDGRQYGLNEICIFGMLTESRVRYKPIIPGLTFVDMWAYMMALLLLH